MAVAVTRPCIVCGTPMITKRSSKKTCSNTCYMRHFRELAKPVVNAPYTIQNKRTSNREDTKMHQQREEYTLRFNIRGCDVLIKINSQPAELPESTMTAHDLRVAVESAVAELQIAGVV